MSPQDKKAAKLGVTRNKRIVIPCSGCGGARHPVEPLDCFCIHCHVPAKPDRCADSLSEQATPAHLKSGGRR